MNDFYFIALLGSFAIVLVVIIMLAATRYKRCPSDKILVVFGKVGKGQSSRPIHGGGVFVWPLIQDFKYLSLTPMPININLTNALSKQNIRIDVPSTFTVGISTIPEIMRNAADRMLGLPIKEIEQLAREIIFGQLRLTVASLDIEEINKDRERFLESIRMNVEPELNKIGLFLINVNLTDITDESDYIDSIGKKAAATAINQAKVDVAEQNKLGAIGESDANREKEIRVAENLASANKGKKKAEADQRIFVQTQEAEAVKGEKKAVAEQRIFVQDQEASAIKGENLSKASIAHSEAELAVKQAEAHQVAQVSRAQAEAKIKQAEYESELERLRAEKVVKEEISKQMTEIAAEASAEKCRREARGEADAILARFEAEADGLRKVLEAKSEGYHDLVESCGGDSQAAATFLMIEKLESIVSKQVEAIQNLKIDKITVWDSGTGNGSGSSTANFLSSFIKSLPPLQELSRQAGIELPDYLGKLVGESDLQETAEKKTDTES